MLELLYLLQSSCKIPMDSLELQGISLYSAFVPHLALEGLSGLGSGYQVLHKKKKKRLFPESGTWDEGKNLE